MTSEDGRLLKSVKRHGVAIAIIAALGWIAVVFLSGWGVNVTGVDWKFKNTAELGDSFGVLSSLMAGIAAYFALQTYRASLVEGAENSKRAVETAFLSLSERRYDVLSKVSYNKPGTKDIKDQNALDRIADKMKENRKVPHRTLKETYDFSVEHMDGVASYLRFTYHIVALIDREFGGGSEEKVAKKDSNAYRYIRLLRAQMSDSELLLIALNCVVGKGYGKFRPLVEKYALLHNLPFDSRKLFGLDEFFSLTAFGLTAEDRDIADDTPPKEWLDAMLPQNQ